MMRLFAIDRLDKYARQRVLDGSGAWTLYRTLADETQARLVGTMMVRLEAEHGHAEANEFLKQKEGVPDKKALATGERAGGLE